MRAQAIEKLVTRLTELYKENSDCSRPEIQNLIRKTEILLDRENGDRAASVIREVMNS